VEEVMTPRIDVIGVDRDSSWEEVVARARSSEHARIVVYEGDLDHITGILYAKDLLPFVADGTEPPAGWPSLVHTPSIIPLSKRVDAQLREFRVGHRHLAVVIDEFGGTAGIVTIEDLLELIVGDIQDEHDTETPELEVGDSGRFWAAGRMSLDDLSEKLGADLRHDEVATVGGLAYELFGRVPKPGEAVSYRSWRLRVENVRGRRVERVQLERIPAPIGAGARE
jgi:putative hemolysin